MDADEPTRPEPGTAPPHLRRLLTSRRVRAVLACGLFLGVGAAVVVAAWTDQENGTTTFAASRFDTESMGAGESAFVSHPTAPGATLGISANALSPGATATTWIDLRTTAATTVAGTLTLTAATPAGTLAPSVGYRAVLVAGGASCTGSFTSGAAFLAGDASTYVSSASVPPTAVPVPVQAASGNTQRVCFEIQLDPAAPSSLQGATGSITWTFTAQSVS